MKFLEFIFGVYWVERVNFYGRVVVFCDSVFLLMFFEVFSS